MTTETFVAGPRADYVCTRCEPGGHCSAEQPWRDLPVNAARCPKCGAKKFMQRLWSGYAPAVSRTGLTPTRLGTEADGAVRVAVNEMSGPELDRQHNNRAAARHAQIHDPYAPKLGGAAMLASVIPGMPITMPGTGRSEAARPILGAPKGLTVQTDVGSVRVDKIHSTVIAGKHSE